MLPLTPGRLERMNITFNLVQATNKILNHHDFKCLYQTIICHVCTLQAVVVKNYVGGLNELNVQKYLIRSGSEREHVPESIELYWLMGWRKIKRYLQIQEFECCSEVGSMYKFLLHNCENIFLVNIFSLALYHSKTICKFCRKTINYGYNLTINGE